MHFASSGKKNKFCHFFLVQLIPRLTQATSDVQQWLACSFFHCLVICASDAQLIDAEADALFSSVWCTKWWWSGYWRTFWRLMNSPLNWDAHRGCEWPDILLPIKLPVTRSPTAPSPLLRAPTTTMRTTSSAWRSTTRRAWPSSPSSPSVWRPRWYRALTATGLAAPRGAERKSGCWNRVIEGRGALELGNCVQCDHGGQRLGFVDFDFVIPLAVQFCLGRWKLGAWHGKLAELLNQSQLNLVSNHHYHPVNGLHSNRGQNTQDATNKRCAIPKVPVKAELNTQ